MLLKCLYAPWNQTGEAMVLNQQGGFIFQLVVIRKWTLIYNFENLGLILSDHAWIHENVKGLQHFV